MKKLEITLDNLKGFWYPVFIWIIKRLYQTISIGYYLNTYYYKRQKGGAWVSEFYQMIGIIVGVVWVFLIEQPILTGRFWVYLGVCVELYKPLEIFLFILDWLFVQERNPVKKYTRSLAGFLLNMVEIGLFFTIVDILCNSTNSYVSVWFTVKDNIYSVFMLKQISGLKNVNLIFSLADIQIIISWFLYVVIIGNVVGSIRRGEKADYKRGKG